jgi:hypothetical protein
MKISPAHAEYVPKDRATRPRQSALLLVSVMSDVDSMPPSGGDGPPFPPSACASMSVSYRAVRR